MQETSPITKIKGIGPKSAAVYEKAGIRTVGDLIRYYPRTYDEMKDPVELSTLSVRDDGAVVAVEGHVEAALSVRYLKNFRIVTGKIRSHGESLDVTWFNMPFMRSQVHPGTTYIFRGQIKAKGRSFYLLQPKVYDLCDYALLQKNLQPVYPLTAGLSEHSLRKAFILLLKQLRERRTAQTHSYVIPKTLKTAAAIRSLPYQLTASQEKVWEEISEELSQKKVMARLVQGDVGCGKTIIAFLALVQTAAAGMQGAIMAPTEVLARQHYDGFVKLVQQAGLPIRAVLLTGSLKAREKREACGLIENGEAQVVIGTHALIQESVRFRNLADRRTASFWRRSEGDVVRKSRGDAACHRHERNSDSADACGDPVWGSRHFGHQRAAFRTPSGEKRGCRPLLPAKGICFHCLTGEGNPGAEK